MLLLIFQIDEKSYSLDINHIVEVVPLVTLNRLPQFPDSIAGIFNYRGSLVPVLDMSLLITGKPSKKLLSTRIIVINFSLEKDGNKDERLLGLLAEQVTETIICEESQFQPTGISIKDALFLGDVMLKEQFTVQHIKLDLLLSNNQMEELFSRVPELLV